MALDFNVDPYYDDFDKTKEFYRILFKPGRAVQARELTQMQTILGNQISSFAKNIFKEGSVVTGGQHQLDDSAFYLKVQPTYDNGISTVTGDFTDIEGKYIVEESTGKIGYVKKYTASNATDLPTLHVSIVAGPQTPFDDSSTFLLVTNKYSVVPLQHFTSTSTGSSGKGMLFHISEGVFYAKSNFVYCPEQTIVLGKYINTPSAVIGLSVTENIVDYIEDSTLLDPALGASNYLAPGADRYKISLELTTQQYTPVATTYPDFIQLSTVVNGQLATDVTTPIYSEIMDTMAKRTYDTSGNFIVKNFIPNIVNNTQDETKLILQVSAGSAFVSGYEIEKISTSTLSLDKARTVATDTAYSVNTTYGNYVYVSNLIGGLADINGTFTVEIHSVIGSQISNSSTKIGTAIVRSVEYNNGSATTINYRLFLDDVTMTNGTFGQAKGFASPTSGNYGNLMFGADVANQSFDSKGQAQLFFPNNNLGLFSLPRTYVEELNNVTFYYNQHFNRNISANTVTVQCNSTSGSESFASGTASGLDVIENYIAVETNTGQIGRAHV